MAYPALPDRRIAYDNDGTSVWGRPQGAGTTAPSVAFLLGLGPSFELTSAQRIAMNDDTRVTTNVPADFQFGGGFCGAMWWFMPEQREVTALYHGYSSSTTNLSVIEFDGSNDTTNGVDGTWETASFPGGIPDAQDSLDLWRRGIKAVSFTGPKRSLRYGWASSGCWLLHLYGEKAAGQTPDDIIFIDHDTTPGVEYQTPEDFGDQPLGTTVVRQFRVKNVSATKTANTINIQCNDTDFSISTDGNTWVTTINITSLAAGAESATMYVRCVTPGAGNQLGPRFARIVVTVGSYT